LWSSSSPNHYPIFLNLRDRPVVVIGAGRVALRKAKGLVDAGALVTVVAPRWEPDFETLPLHLIRRRFRTSDLTAAVLVFAATDDRSTNHKISVLARKRGIWANIADAPDECDFIVPARIRRGNVQIAISTGGKSPRLAAEMRKKLEGAL